MQSAWLRGLSIAALIPLLSAGEARAADCHPTSGFSPCIDADNLWPHAGGGPYFALGSATTTPRGGIAFGVVGTFLTQPIGVHVASADPAGSNVFIVDKALDATLLFALGVTDRLELTLAAPATLYQSGSGLGVVVGSAPPLAHSAVRDLRFGFALAMLTRPRTGEERGPALTGRLEFAAPTGTLDGFARGPSAVIAPSLAFSYRLGRVDLGAEALARLRGTAALANAVVGPQVGGAVGASVDILGERWLSAGAEAFVLYTTAKQLPDPLAPAGAAPPVVPAEWIAHASTAHFLDGGLTLSAGGGTSIPTSSHPAFTSPQYRLDFSVRYAPTGRGASTHQPGVPGASSTAPASPASDPPPPAAGPSVTPGA